MRAVIQRVSRASVTVAGEVTGAIDAGVLVLLGITHDDDYLEHDSVAAVGDLADLDGGDGPGFMGVNSDPVGGPGVTIGVVYCTSYSMNSEVGNSGSTANSAPLIRQRRPGNSRATVSVLA